MSPTSSKGAEKNRRETAAYWALKLADPHAARDGDDFQRWMDADPQNPPIFAQVASSLAGVDEHAAAPAMLKLRKEALRMADRLGDRRRAKDYFKSPVGIGLGVSVGLLMTALAATWFWLNGHGLSTAIGERRVVSLRDGSRVSLDAATRIRVDYSADKRRLVLEEGRAKFDVRHDALRPFTVEAGDRLIVALGTSFSVEKVSRQVRVLLYDGRVEVLPLHPNASPTPARSGPGTDRVTLDLAPGQELIADELAEGATSRIARIDAGRSLAWESGELAFADEPLTSAIERVNRYSDHRLTIGDARALHVRVSGIFHAGDVNAFVDGITTVLPLRAAPNKGGYAIFFSPKTPAH